MEREPWNGGRERVKAGDKVCAPWSDVSYARVRQRGLRIKRRQNDISVYIKRAK